MPITYPLTFPTVKEPSRVQLTARAFVSRTISPFTGEQQIQAHQGQLWEAEVEFPIMARANADVVTGFLVKLNGREGTFLMGDPAGSTPKGSAASTPGTPVVKGGGQTGVDLTVDGLPINTTAYLITGDYIQLGSSNSARLYKVLDNVDTGSTGDATVTIWPKLRSSPADNAAVVVNNAVGRFRLDDQPQWDAIPDQFYRVRFVAIEAI